MVESARIHNLLPKNTIPLSTRLIYRTKRRSRRGESCSVLCCQCISYTLYNTVNVWWKRGPEKTAFHYAKSSIMINGIRQASRLNKKKLPAFCWLQKHPFETFSLELDEEQRTAPSAYRQTASESKYKNIY